MIRHFRLSSSSSTSLEPRDEGKMAAMEQERYAFSRGDGYGTYGGCQAGFPTAVELQLQSAAAAVLGAGVSGTALTRTRVVPVSSPRGRRNSGSASIVSVLLPCVSRADVTQNVTADKQRDVVVCITGRCDTERHHRQTERCCHEEL